MSAEHISTSTRRVLLTGATGYIGGRLLRRLEERGATIRCMARRPESLDGRVGPHTEVVRGDCLVPASLDAALRGVDTAYYLVHSMGSGADFEKRDRVTARNFGGAARRAGVHRIIYVGGLGDRSHELSPHLRSRQETGTILRDSGVQVIELRASIVLGSGSLSFEMIRALVERLPVMICPSWVSTVAQPIAIEDLLSYLVAVLDWPGAESRVFEVGGTDRVSYGDLMREYARQRRLRRWMVPVPVLTPHLSSLWLGLVTPVYARVGRELIESLRNRTVVDNDDARPTFPAIQPLGVPDAIRRAMINEDREFAETRWCDALSSGSTPRTWGGVRFGTRLVDSRAVFVDAPPDAAFTPIRRIGAANGWYYGDFLWHLRGFLDLLAGGVGLRRGRRDPEHLHVGDPLDFWRVESVEPDRRLRLAAEMKLPGRAWLELEVQPSGAGSLIRQTAEFDPVGLLGLAYWYALYPIHTWMFEGMLREIAARVPRPAAEPRVLPFEPRRKARRG